VNYWQRNGTVLSPTTADDTVEIPNATDEDMLKLLYTGNGVEGPTLTFEHDSATQANNDILGELLFSGNNSTPAMTDYVRLRAYSENVLAGSEDGGLGIEMQVDSTFKSVLDLWPDRAVINEDGVDIDFRVEGENVSDLIYTDASTDRIGICTSTPAAVLDINGNDTATEKGYTLRIERDLAAADTDKPVVEIVQDHVDDDQIALRVTHHGTSPAVSILATGLNDSFGAVQGLSTKASGVNHGVVGAVSSSDNAAYGGKFDQTLLGAYSDYLDSSNSPLAASPPAGIVRAIAGDDGRLYAIDSDANRHDLTQRTPHYFAGWTAAQNAAKDKTWDSDAYNSGLGIEATVVAAPIAGFDFTNQGALDAHGVWEWTASVFAIGEPPDQVFIYEQSQAAVWTPYGRQGDNNDNCRVYVQARIKVSAVADFENVYLVLNDVTTANAFASNALSADQLTNMADDTWYIATLAVAGTDVGGWNPTMRAGVLAQGKLYEAETEGTKVYFYLDWIKVYMYGN